MNKAATSSSNNHLRKTKVDTVPRSQVRRSSYHVSKIERLPKPHRRQIIRWLLKDNLPYLEVRRLGLEKFKFEISSAALSAFYHSLSRPAVKQPDGPLLDLVITGPARVTLFRQSGNVRAYHLTKKGARRLMASSQRPPV